MMSLRQEIEQLLAGFSLPAEIAARIAQGYASAARSEIAPGIELGAAAPDFELSSSRGESVRLSRRLAHGPAVVTFFRGAWCPVCNLQLAAFHRAMPDIRAAGGSVLALHPDSGLPIDEPPEGFEILSDADQSVISAYRLQFQIPLDLRNLYLGSLDLNVADQNLDGSWNLPVPGTFIVDQDGIVRHRHVSADYTERMEPSDVIDALKEIRA